MLPLVWDNKSFTNGIFNENVKLIVETVYYFADHFLQILIKVIL